METKYKQQQTWESLNSQHVSSQGNKCETEIQLGFTKQTFKIRQFGLVPMVTEINDSMEFVSKTVQSIERSTKQQRIQDFPEGDATTT